MHIWSLLTSGQTNQLKATIWHIQFIPSIQLRKKEKLYTQNFAQLTHRHVIEKAELFV